MAAIKSIDTSANKLVTNAQNAGQAYADGTANPRRPWAASAKAAEASYTQGVQSAVAKGSFGKGVTAAGDAKHAKGCKEKGTVRFGPGVATSKDAYVAGFSPYHAAIAAVTLPPRRARRDPANLARVTAIDTALATLKESRSK